MFRLATVILLLATVQQPPAAPAAASDLTLTLVADKAEYVIGDEIQVQVSLGNATDKDISASELCLEERSLSFDITFDAAGGKKKQFLFSVTRPDPHLVDRVTLPRVTLKARTGMMVGIFRIPTLRTGALSLTAVYKGGEKELRSPSLTTLKVIPQAGDAGRLAAAVKTSKGSFTIDLFPDEAPNNVANFVSLAKRGFYNNMNFHRVIKNSWIQTGCPYDNGYGGPGYAVKSEAEGQKGLSHDVGTVAMSGNLKNGYTGSQFYISLSKIPAFDSKFTIVGKVQEAGLGVLRDIGNVEVDKTTDRPSKEDVRLSEVSIVVVK
jgi:peptidyl-prolyl cis-trans isomerase B (cyclophilin B)